MYKLIQGQISKEEETLGIKKGKDIESKIIGMDLRSKNIFQRKKSLLQYKQNAPLTILRNRMLVKVEMIIDTFQTFKIYLK